MATSTPTELECPAELRRFLRYQPRTPGPTADNLQELEQLLETVWNRPNGKTAVDDAIIRHFQTLCGLTLEEITECEQRILHNIDRKPPLTVGFDSQIGYRINRVNALNLAVTNTSNQILKEVLVRFNSADLELVEHAQPRPIKNMERQLCVPCYLRYRAPTPNKLATLSLEVDVCDAQSRWRAYNSRYSILLNFSELDPDGEGKVKIRTTHQTNSMLVHTPVLKGSAPPAELPEEERPPTGGRFSPLGRRIPSPQNMLPIELDLDQERTRQLQTVHTPTIAAQEVTQRLSRALLHCHNMAHAPQRIELVSRPFMVFGRYNEQTGRGFGDFALGFVKDFGRISRQQFAIYVKGAEAAILHASLYEETYTGLNGQRLKRGFWQRLDANDVIDVCGLYRMRILFSWDDKTNVTDTTQSGSGEAFGQALMEVIDLLKEAETKGGDALKQKLRIRYSRLIQSQADAAQQNGIEKGGPLRYIRFCRDDAGQDRVTHIYLPKRLPIGSSAQSGLQVMATGIMPHHAELLFKDGTYWIKNLADSVALCVNDQPTPLQAEVLLRHGDRITMGNARFNFEGY